MRRIQNFSFLLFCTLFVIDGDDDIRYHDLEFLYEEGEADWRWAKRGLSQGDHLFLVEKFIEYTNDDGFVDRESFKITDDAKKLLSLNSTCLPCVVSGRREGCCHLRTSNPSNCSTAVRNESKLMSWQHSWRKSTTRVSEIV